MTQFNRTHMSTLSTIFDKFALKDQEKYYKHTIEYCQRASTQVNTIRATLAFIAGAVSANIAYLAAADVGEPGFVIPTLIAIAVIAPALGSAFSALTDLYQWNRLETIYDAALESLIIADAESPKELIKENKEYQAQMEAFTAATLAVMREEQAQWGQLSHKPEQIEDYLKRVEERTQTSLEKNEDDDAPGE